MEVENYRMRRRAGEEVSLKVALAVAGTLPTVIWALRDPALMVDDWSYAATARLKAYVASSRWCGRVR